MKYVASIGQIDQSAPIQIDNLICQKMYRITYRLLNGLRWSWLPACASKGANRNGLNLSLYI